MCYTAYMYLQLPLQYILGQNPASLFTLQMQAGTRKLEMKKKRPTNHSRHPHPLVIPVAFRGIFDIFQKYFRRNEHTRNSAFQI